MGFYTNQKIKAKCPLYEGIVKSKNSKIAGIQCDCMDPGHDASFIIRLHGYNDMMRYKRHYCDSEEGYRTCRCYQEYVKSIK